MKVLVWGVLQDPPTQLVYDALLRLQADFVFIDHSEIENTSIRYNSFKHPEYYIDHSGITFHHGRFYRCLFKALRFHAVRAVYKHHGYEIWLKMHIPYTS